MLYTIDEEVEDLFDEIGKQQPFERVYLKEIIHVMKDKIFVYVI